MGPHRWKTPAKNLLSAAVVAEHYCASLAIRTWSISVNWNATSNGPVVAAISGQQCQPLQELKEEFSSEFSTYKAPLQNLEFWRSLKQVSGRANAKGVARLHTTCPLCHFQV